MATELTQIQLIECPRDAMQGWPVQIATADKINYINALLAAGFHTIDFGSFVSPKAIPQMADTRAVLAGLDLSATRSALLAIVANTRGGRDAAAFDVIRYMGFPFSVSETFQLRNTNSTIAHSLQTVDELMQLCLLHNKELVVYLSMAFGNPYGDEWSEEIVFQWAEKLVGIGVKIISLADTVGVATAQQVGQMTGVLIRALPGVTVGVHLHAVPDNWQPKLQAAYDAGCRRFDSALRGIGGCPMAGDELVGNMDMLNLLNFCAAQGISTGISGEAVGAALVLADKIFTPIH
jgi:hydroxymethylglutaryl-CoA lyase